MYQRPGLFCDLRSDVVVSSVDIDIGGIVDKVKSIYIDIYYIWCGFRTISLAKSVT